MTTNILKVLTESIQWEASLPLLDQTYHATGKAQLKECVLIDPFSLSC